MAEESQNHFEVMDDSKKVETLRQLMRLGLEPLKLLLAMSMVIDPAAVNRDIQKAEAN